MLNGKIYDANSIDKFCTNFGELLKDQQVRLAEPLTVGETVYDAETVVSNGMFVEQQLRQILPTILEQKFPGMPGLDIVKNIDNSGAYMQSLIQRIESYQGDFADINEISDDKGLLTFARDGKTIDIRTKKGYSVYDNITAERAKMLGENIDAALIKTHKIKYDQFIDEMIFVGMKDSLGNSLTDGISNYANYATGLRLDSDNTFATYAASKDGWGMYSQLEKLYNAHIAAAAGYEGFYPKTLVTSPSAFAYLSTTPMANSAGGAISGETVLSYAMRVLKLDKAYASIRMVGKGDGSSDRLAFLNAESDANPNMTLYIPMPLQFLPVKVDLGDYHIASQFRVAGISVNYKECISYLDKV